MLRRVRPVLLGAALALIAVPAWAVQIVPGTATAPAISSGINAENLADTPVTDTLPVGERMKSVVLQAIVTAGTSAQVDVSCEESSNASNWTWIVDCTGGTCAKAVRSFNVTTLASFSVTIEEPAPYLRCTFDDAANGTGTIIVRGTVLAP